MKQLTITLLFVFSITVLFAQSDFKAGYVINNNRDTIAGLIDYKGDIANSKNCLFKRNDGSEEIKFNPEDIFAFRFTDSKYYVTKKVKLNETEELLFLEYLIDGIVDVYYFRDNSGDNYLIDTGDGKLQSLTNFERVIYEDETKYLTQSNRYIGILKYIFKDSPQVSQKVEKVKLDHQSLIEITRDYHNAVCTDKECIIFEKKLPAVKLFFGPKIALNVTILHVDVINDDDYDYLLGSDFNTAFYPTYGLILNLNLPYLNERLFFQYEVAIGKRSFKTININSIYHLHEVNDIRFSQLSLSNSFLLRYEFPVGKIRPSFHSGIYFNKYLNTNYSHKVIHANGYTKEYVISPFANSDIGWIVGAGLIINITKKHPLYIDLAYKHGIRLMSFIYEDNFVVSLSYKI